MLPLRIAEANRFPRSAPAHIAAEDYSPSAIGPIKENSREHPSRQGVLTKCSQPC